MKGISRLLNKELVRTGLPEIEAALQTSAFSIAERSLRKALRLRLSRKARSTYLSLLSSVLHQKKRHAAALRYKKEALALMPNDPFLRIGLAHDMLAFSMSCEQAMRYLAPVFRRRLARTYKWWAYDVAGQLALKLGHPSIAKAHRNRLLRMKLTRGEWEQCGLRRALRSHAS